MLRINIYIYIVILTQFTQNNDCKKKYISNFSNIQANKFGNEILFR